MKKREKCDGTMCENDTKDTCGVINKISGKHCTLISGHTGLHIACSFSIHNIATWENKNETNPTNDTDDIND